MWVKTIYQCGECGKNYDDYEAADDCCSAEELPTDPDEG